MDILQKKNQWVTCEDIGKDLKPYLDELDAKLLLYHDDEPAFIIKELDTVKELLPTVEAVNQAASYETSDLYLEYCDLIRALKKMPGRKNDKLKDLLKAQTGLLETQKTGILEAWEYQDIDAPFSVSGDLAVMEEYIRTKSAEVYECRVKLRESENRSTEMVRLYRRTRATKKLMEHRLVFPEQRPLKMAENHIGSSSPHHGSSSMYVGSHLVQLPYLVHLPWVSTNISKA